MPAAAAPTWLPGETVSGPAFQLTLSPRIAVDPFGNATAVWYHSVASVGLVRASHRPAGGTWSAPLTISDPTRFAQVPDIVVDRFGTVTAVWIANAPGGNQIEAARLPLGGSSSAPGLVGPGDLAGPKLAVDSAGFVTAVWLEARTDYIVRTSSLAPGGTWTVGKDLSDVTHGSTSPQVAVDPVSGASVALWQMFDGTYSLVYASRRPPGGAWSSPQLVSESAQDTNINPQVSIDTQGTATVVFGKYFSGHHEAFWSSAPAGLPWSTPTRFSAPGNPAPDGTVVSTPTGQTVAAWSEAIGGTSVVRSSTRQANGNWYAPLSLSDPAGSASGVSLGAGPDGTAYLVWSWYSGGDGSTQQISHQPPGGAWSAAVDLATGVPTTVDPVHAIGVDEPRGRASPTRTPRPAATR